MLLLALVCLLNGCAGGRHGLDTVPRGLDLEVLEDGDVRVRVTIEGRGPYRFLLDTGSSRSAIARRVADELALPTIRRSRLVTPGGTMTVGLLRAVRVGLAHASPTVVEPMVLDADRFDPQRADGILGQDVLARLTYTIDYRARRLELHGPQHRRPVGVRLPYDTGGGHRLATLSVTVAGRESWSLVADSGADRLVLFRDERHPLPGRSIRGSASIRGLAARHDVTGILIDTLRLGSLRLDAVPAVVMPPPAEGHLADGLLPLSLFSRVTFSARDQTVTIER